jgi:hypothetical protein
MGTSSNKKIKIPLFGWDRNNLIFENPLEVNSIQTQLRGRVKGTSHNFTKYYSLQDVCLKRRMSITRNSPTLTSVAGPAPPTIVRPGT